MYDEGMTICIAGIAEGKKIVAITDKMLTMSGQVTTKFEVSSNDKGIKLNKKAVGLFAGDVLEANAILTEASKDIKDDTPVSEVAEMILKAYKKRWNEIIASNLLNRFGMSLQQFMEKQSDLHEELVRRINKILIEHDLEVDIIVAGVEGEGKPRIFGITNPGLTTCYDAIGYHCIGSGSQHATFALIENEYHGGISEKDSLHALIQAKKRAEYDPGVGKLADIVIINDEFKKLRQTDIDCINGIYENALKAMKNDKDNCANAIFEVVYPSTAPANTQ